MSLWWRELRGSSARLPDYDTNRADGGEIQFVFTVRDNALGEQGLLNGSHLARPPRTTIRTMRKSTLIAQRSSFRCQIGPCPMSATLPSGRYRPVSWIMRRSKIRGGGRKVLPHRRLICACAVP